MTRVTNRDRGAGRMLVAVMAMAAAFSVVVAVNSPLAGAAEAYSNGKLVNGIAGGASGGDIGVINPDGTEPQNLTASWMHDGGYSTESEPAWSPDGSKIALVSNRGGSEGAYSLWLMDADGSNATQLVTAAVTAPGQTAPSWSPDGEWIVFSGSHPSDPDGIAALVKIRADGTGETAVTNPTGEFEIHGSPKWSPDGEWIAYRVTNTGDDDSIDLVRPDGTGHRVLLPTMYAAGHDWSPDGKKLVYHDFITGLFTVNADGSGAALLLTQKGATGPVWSPDGTTILYTVVDFPTHRVYTIPSSGGTPVLVPLPAGFGGPWAWDWQPVPKAIGAPIVGLVDPAQGLWHLFDDAGVEGAAFFFGNPGDYPIVGDWNCDGVETPGMYRQSDGYVYLRNSNTQGAADIRFFFGDPGDVPIAGDFNKDGCDTVSIYRPVSQTFFIINALGANDGGLGAAEFSYVFGDPGDKPFVGDFDGDGTETVGLHRESTGLVYFRNSHTQGNADAQFIFGDPGDRLIAGDWNGDGAYSPALFRPSNTTMFLRYTNTQGNADNQFIPAGSQPGWLPVAGVFSK